MIKFRGNICQFICETLCIASFADYGRKSKFEALCENEV